MSNKNEREPKKQPVSDDVISIKLKGDSYQQTLNGELIDINNVAEHFAKNSNYAEILPSRLKGAQLFLHPLQNEGIFEVIDSVTQQRKNLSFDQMYSLSVYASMGVNQAVYRLVAPKIRFIAPSPEFATRAGFYASMGNLDQDFRIPFVATDQKTTQRLSVALLTMIATKEAYVGLTAEEIAGFVAGINEIDTFIRLKSSSPISHVSVMGGTREHREDKNLKVLDPTILTSIVLANFDNTYTQVFYQNKYPTSYSYSSPVSSQIALEKFGIRTDQNSPEALSFLLSNTHLLFTSAHTTKTIHALSYLLQGELLDHILLPLALPFSTETPIYAQIGANRHISPETLINTMIILRNNHIQHYANSIAYAGLNISVDNDQNIALDSLQTQVVIDGVAIPPYSTIAAFLIDGKNSGTYVIQPDDFMEPETLSSLDFNKLYVQQEPEAINVANQETIMGKDSAKAAYVAMHAALGMFVRKYSNLPDALDSETHRVNRTMLRTCFSQVYESIKAGDAQKKLHEVIEVSKDSLKLNK